MTVVVVPADHHVLAVHRADIPARRLLEPRIRPFADHRQRKLQRGHLNHADIRLPVDLPGGHLHLGILDKGRLRRHRQQRGERVPQLLPLLPQLRKGDRLPRAVRRPGGQPSCCVANPGQQRALRVHRPARKRVLRCVRLRGRFPGEGLALRRHRIRHRRKRLRRAVVLRGVRLPCRRSRSLSVLRCIHVRICFRGRNGCIRLFAAQLRPVHRPALAVHDSGDGLAVLNGPGHRLALRIQRPIERIPTRIRQHQRLRLVLLLRHDRHHPAERRGGGLVRPLLLAGIVQRQKKGGCNQQQPRRHQKTALAFFSALIRPHRVSFAAIRSETAPCLRPPAAAQATRAGPSAAACRWASREPPACIFCSGW